MDEFITKLKHEIAGYNEKIGEKQEEKQELDREIEEYEYEIQMRQRELKFHKINKDGKTFILGGGV